MDRLPGGGSAGAVSSRYHRLAPASSVAGWLVPPLPFFFSESSQESWSLEADLHNRWTDTGGTESNATDSTWREKGNVFKERHALGQNATCL